MQHLRRRKGEMARKCDLISTFFFFFFCSFKSEQTVEGETRRWLTYFYGNWCVDEFVLLLH